MARSASGAGSNYEEGRGAESTADFIHELSIATKELREAHYWLRLLERAHLLTTDAPLAPLIDEGNQLIAILTASIRTTKARHN